MDNDPSYIDVGMLYLFGLGLTLAVVIAGVRLARRWRWSGFEGVWDSVRSTLLGLALTIGVGAVCIGVLTGAAYGIGWLAHLLKWWPY